MKWIYIILVLVIAALASGCVDKKQAETPEQTPDLTPVSTGEAAVTPVATSAAGSQTPLNGDDLFGTESNLSTIDETFEDMNMEISLLDSI